MEHKKRTYGQKADPAVEAPSEDTVKVRSLRLSDDTVEELNAAKKALDVRTMDEAMLAILDTFSMSKQGLDTSHIGIAVWHADGLHLLNASQIRHKVVEEPMTLAVYMSKHPKQTGIRVIRIKVD